MIRKVQDKDFYNVELTYENYRHMILFHSEVQISIGKRFL